MIQAAREYFFSKYDTLYKKHKEGKIPFDVHGWAVAIIDKFVVTELGKKFVTSPGMVKLMKQYLGPDVAILGYDALWINVPQDKSPVLSKSLHTDAWTGTSVNSIFVKTFFTDTDEFNSITMFPGTHLMGMIPVRNRAIDPNSKIDVENLPSVNLSHMEIGDIVIWHPLLVHSTTGHSDKNIRISITSRFTSTETEFSSQERGLGYRPLSVGPLNQVRRLIGNDLLTPFRTYGGFVGIDRRLKELYGDSDYEVDEDYSQYI